MNQARINNFIAISNILNQSQEEFEQLTKYFRAKYFAHCPICDEPKLMVSQNMFGYEICCLACDKQVFISSGEIIDNIDKYGMSDTLVIMAVDKLLQQAK